MRITSKGQVTIPIAIREELGLHAGTEIEFAVRGDGVRLTRAKGSHGGGRSAVDRLRGRATTALSTDEIMRLTRG
jgi:AbrB family looped-hinge helix DNA binding protein